MPPFSWPYWSYHFSWRYAIILKKLPQKPRRKPAKTLAHQHGKPGKNTAETNGKNKIRTSVLAHFDIEANEIFGLVFKLSYLLGAGSPWTRYWARVDLCSLLGQQHENFFIPNVWIRKILNEVNQSIKFEGFVTVSYLFLRNHDSRC